MTLIKETLLFPFPTSGPDEEAEEDATIDTDGNNYTRHGSGDIHIWVVLFWFVLYQYV